MKADMERPAPMDRLISGDVGFGKTEVALRAAFKCVLGGRQVAILAPTTVLAQQHFEASRTASPAGPSPLNSSASTAPPSRRPMSGRGLRPARSTSSSAHTPCSPTARASANLASSSLTKNTASACVTRSDSSRCAPRSTSLAMSATPIPRDSTSRSSVRATSASSRLRHASACPSAPSCAVTTRSSCATP
ncbi:transcription-repair-coupling factor [Opitutia bacterium]|nr:transcription-repair-coupling factor [Opitutae bacterium]